MDNQNQTNQPTGQGFPPIVPSVPEDITPSDVPVTTTTTTTVTAPQQTTASEISSIPPVEVALAPTNPPVSQPMMPPIPTAEPFSVPTAAPLEPEMPSSKPKNKMLPIIGGIAALLLVVGVAGASYYVSNQLSTRQAVAPTAPESKPAAFVCELCREDQKGDGTYDSNGCAHCVPIGGGDDGGGGGGGGSCVASVAGVGTTHPACVGKSPGSEVCYTNPSNDYSSSLVCTSTTQGLCSALAGGNACGSGGGGGVPTSCTRSTGSGGANSCYLNTTNELTCSGTFGLACGNECCGNGAICCCTGCFPASDGCASHGGTTCPIDQPTSTVSPTASPTASPTISPTVTPIVGACMNIKIYKKVGGAYQTTPLTAADLQNLKVGDVLKFGITSNANNLRGRFKVTVAGTAGSWLSGTIDATNKKLVTYTDYTISSAGTYKFEAQVTTTP